VGGWENKKKTKVGFGSSGFLSGCGSPDNLSSNKFILNMSDVK